jgi:hypothetical protein
MRKIISLICFLLPVLAFAGQQDSPPQIRSDAPDQYTVVKGDTLWGISGKFFSDPWRWPYIWGMNKNDIKDPHWIYPGETIVLDRAHGTLSFGNGNRTDTSDTVKLSPQIRAEDSTQNEILSIPSQAIEPFLSQPLVMDDTALAGAPTLVGLSEDRLVVSPGSVAYAKGLTEDKGKNWQVYRPGKTFIDPETGEVLGHEAIYLGAVSVRDFADVSTVVLTDAKQEINIGDRLVASSTAVAHNYLPRAPETKIAARVIAIYGGLTQAGPNAIVTLNKGSRDGLQSGHVLALASRARAVKSGEATLALPEDRYGLLFVFRVFDKVSYALVMQAHKPVQVLDQAVTP